MQNIVIFHRQCINCYFWLEIACCGNKFILILTFLTRPCSAGFLTISHLCQLCIGWKEKIEKRCCFCSSVPQQGGKAKILLWWGLFFGVVGPIIEHFDFDLIWKSWILEQPMCGQWKKIWLGWMKSMEEKQLRLAATVHYLLQTWIYSNRQTHKYKHKHTITDIYTKIQTQTQ